MTQPTTSVRWSAVSAFLDLLRQQPALAGDVQIEPGHPGTDLRAESIWVDEITGINDIPVFGPSRIVRNDDFHLSLRVITVGADTLDDAMTRLFVMIGSIEDVLANTPTLNDLPGVLWGELLDHNETAVRTQEGIVGYAEVVLMIHTRLN